ncbi:MAG: hypothetical protein KJO38_10350, partial [Gammaproteobacteria bacterium]|nr:hypothetical protein [Gammaproteobacteria bacterium]
MEPAFVFEPDTALFLEAGLGGTDDLLVPNPLAVAGLGFAGGALFTSTVDLNLASPGLTGTWTPTADAGSVGGSTLVANAAAAGVGAEWAFTDLDPVRSYLLRLSLPDLVALGITPAAVSEYFVAGAAQTRVVIPAGTTADDVDPVTGVAWLRLGSFQPDADGTLRISLGPQTDVAIHPELLADNGAGLSETAILGAPDGSFASLGSAAVTYDFDTVQIQDGAGADLRVYTAAGPGGPDPFAEVDVLVGVLDQGALSYVSVKASETQGITESAAGLGFDNGAFASGNVLLASVPPALDGATPFALAGDIRFELSTSRGVVEATLTAAATSGNTTIEQLAAALESAINDPFIQVSDVGGLLQITDLSLSGPLQLSFEVDLSEGRRYADYALPAGTATATLVRLQGPQNPTDGGFQLDAIEGLNVAPAGALVADAIELIETNASILVAEPLGSRALVYFGAKPADVTGSGPGGGSSNATGTLFTYEAATPLPPGAAPFTGISLLDPAPLVDDALALEGAAADEGLNTIIDLGDISGDGVDDLMLVGEGIGYVLFGPADLVGIENVADAAEFIVNLDDLGTPAERVGDIDGDGLNDLMFIDGLQITVLVDQPTWPRTLDAASLAALTSTAGSSYTILLNSFDDTGVSLQALNWDGDEFGDILVTGAPYPGGFGTFGYIFDGKTIVDEALRPPGAPVVQSEAMHVLRVPDQLAPENVAAQIDLATELLGGYVPGAADLGTATNLAVRVVGDVDGDGRDDILF